MRSDAPVCTHTLSGSTARRIAYVEILTKILKRGRDPSTLISEGQLVLV